MMSKQIAAGAAVADLAFTAGWQHPFESPGYARKAKSPQYGNFRKAITSRDLCG
jgi:hypothetical protein